MLELRLFPGLPGGRRARLGPITGAVEEGIASDDPGGFALLLDQLLVGGEATTVGPGRALDLAISDHDRIATALYCWYYGSAVESTVRCRQCGRDFDVAFDLSNRSDQALPHVPAGIEGPDETGTFRLNNGTRFRLPTLRDQLATREFPTDQARRELLLRCTDAAPASDQEFDAVEHAMETVGPLIAGTIAADCPHCHFHEDTMRFSIQQYLLDALAFERRFLPAEVHCVARTYGWSRREIMAMPTSERRQHVRMILADTPSR